MTYRKRQKTTACLGIGLLFFFLGILLIAILAAGVPYMAYRTFGESSPALTFAQRWQYSAQVTLNARNLKSGLYTTAPQFTFTIQSGESINDIAYHLETSGLIPDAGAFRSYLIYKGYDTQIKAGDHLLSPAMSPVQIADAILNVYSDEVTFVILPGWRAEEIAASLPTSGINVTQEEFLRVVNDPSVLHLGQFLPEGATLEGFLYPGEYLINRNISAVDLVRTFVQRFQSQVSPEIRSQIEGHGLTFYQGIILASIVQRETFEDSERPQIASVFYNRLASGMKLETDPTVQYSLGYSSEWGSWWKSPLSSSDLAVQSDFNTYLINGLPPHPICNPALAAIQAVASPAETDFYYFRAKCDGSGLHIFAKTFEEHVANACQ